jgi:Zn-dependent protease
MESNIKLGSLFGIEIGVSYSWFIIFALITFSFWESFSSQNGGWPAYIPVVAAFAASVLFFFSILGHELSHSLMALANGLPVRSITLFIFGGISRIEKEATRAATEFWVAVVGPISSFVIGLIFLAVWKLVDPSSPLAVVAYWLGLINITLALFNLVPGFPLDGGRVLRAIIWAVSGSSRTATRVSSTIGQGVGYMLITFGILVALFVKNNLLGGAWIAIIGWFLLAAARSTRRSALLEQVARGGLARDVMSASASVVPINNTLQEFFDGYMLRTGRRCFIAGDSGRLLGLITDAELKKMDRDRWSSITVAQAMRPFDTMRWVAPDADISQVLEVMDRDDTDQVPVVSDGRLEGLIRREDVVRLMQTRAEFEY